MGWVVYATRLGLFMLGVWSGTHCMGCWIGSRADLDRWI